MDDPTSHDPAHPRDVAQPRDLTLDLGACPPGTTSQAVSAALLSCPGVEQAYVDRYVTWALATFEPDATSPAKIVDLMRRAGFAVRVSCLFQPGPVLEHRDLG